MNVTKEIAGLYGKNIGEEFTLRVFGLSDNVRAKFTQHGLLVKYADKNTFQKNETIFDHLITGQADIIEQE